MRFSLHRAGVVLAVLAVASTSFTPRLGAQDRPTKVRKDRESYVAAGRWIYNDLPKGFEEAKKTGKPLLVAIRCIPCEACKGFDELVAANDPRIAALLDRFVRVRMPQTNGLDLSLFQFDYDVSFYAFFLNADRTIYGRFGSRTTQEDKTGQVSLDAFREAMEAALSLHERFPQVRDSLKGKTGPAPEFASPELYPSLKSKYTKDIDYDKKPVESCIHCHMIREAERLIYRKSGKPLPERVLFPWPLPDVLGLHLVPSKRAEVARVDAGSAAERSGLLGGDQIVAIEGQPLISIADFQWVLQQAGDEGSLDVRFRRGTEEKSAKLALDQGWRRRNDISWRSSTWELRRMATGGLLLKDLPKAEREKRGIAETGLALRVEHAGEYGEHATAKNAGIKKGDVIIAIDGRTDPGHEWDLIAYGVQKKTAGEQLTLTVLRGDQKKDVTFALK